MCAVLSDTDRHALQEIILRFGRPRGGARHQIQKGNTNTQDDEEDEDEEDDDDDDEEEEEEDEDEKEEEDEDDERGAQDGNGEAGIENEKEDVPGSGSAESPDTMKQHREGGSQRGLVRDESVTRHMATLSTEDGKAPAAARSSSVQAPRTPSKGPRTKQAKLYDLLTNSSNSSSSNNGSS